MIHPDTPDNPIVSDFVRGRLYSSASAWSVISIAVGAALALLGAGPAKAAYYHNYGYYDYGYRAPPPRHLRSASRKRTKKPRDVQAKKVESKPIKGPLTIVVSIGEQRVRVFDSTTLIAESPSSTGTRAYPTPMGVFSIIQKDRIHYSNLYQNAPMPYMQRLTWSGTAMHTGVLPGYAASHGCIRLPNSIAARLWKITKLGTRVIVARHGLQPAPITHAKLDLLKRKPAEATQVVEGATGKTMATEGPVATDGAGTPMPNITAMEPKPAMPVLAKPKPIINEAYLMVPAAKLLIAPDPAIADPTSAYPATSGAAPKPLKPGPVAIFISKKEGKLFVRKGFEPVFDIPIKIENPDTPLGTHVYTATQAKEGSLGMDWIALSLPPEARVASRTDKRSRARGAKHQVPAPPVPTATADEALDRVELPAEVLERLAEMLSPGASLIISDKGLGPQTGKGTNFIVLSR